MTDRTPRDQPQGFLGESSDLPASLLPRVCHLRGATCPRPREKAGYLSYPTPEDQKGSLRIPGSSRVLPHLGPRILSSGKATVRGHGRIRQGLPKWGQDQGKAFQERKCWSSPLHWACQMEGGDSTSVHARDHTALGVLTWACLSPRLDPVASGRPPCLRALAATMALMREADKLPLGHPVTVPMQLRL